MKHSSREYVRDAVHVNSVEGFNSRVRRTIAGVFHHISPQHADLYFHEIGFRWSQRIVSGQAVRKSRNGKERMKALWRGCRRRCNCCKSFACLPVGKCAEVRMVGSSSNQPSLSLVDKGPIHYAILEAQKENLNRAEFGIDTTASSQGAHVSLSINFSTISRSALSRHSGSSWSNLKRTPMMSVGMPTNLVSSR